MTLLDELSKKEVWLSFHAYKKERNQLTVREDRQLKVFIEQERYLKITAFFSFDYPVKKIISKMNSSKKRTVYCYSEDETWVLKLLAFLLYRYDDKIADNCYSFRQNITARTAFDDIRKIEDLDNLLVLKLDIHDYFNSIDTDILHEILDAIINDDEPLLNFMSQLIRQDKCYFHNELISEKRGAMAGVPIASFLANIYLKDLDEYFLYNGIPYFRYSDDIIMFFKDEKERDSVYRDIITQLKDKKLELNIQKLKFYHQHDKWEYLGFCYHDGSIDLSDATVQKMKDKIRRKAHSLYRWRKHKNADYDLTAVKMIRSFDYKFYDLNGNNEFTWTRFYFPVITKTDGLKEVDAYMVKYLRYLYSGRHYKGNYAITYDHLKKLGYTSLVNEYYHWKKDSYDLLRSQLS